MPQCDLQFSLTRTCELRILICDPGKKWNDHNSSRGESALNGRIEQRTNLMDYNSPLHFSALSFSISAMRQKKTEGAGISVREAGRRGGRMTTKKYSRRQRRAWAKLGGRPRKKSEN
jgi:hypothetical protein